MSKHTKWKAVEVGVSGFGPDAVPAYEIMTADDHVRICEYILQEHAVLAVECVNAWNDPAALRARLAALALHDEREAFEAAMSEKLPGLEFLREASGEYAHADTHCAWLAFCVGRAMPVASEAA